MKPFKAKIFFSLLLLNCVVGCTNKPPIHENSILYYRSDLNCMELVCGGLGPGIPPQEKQFFSPEIWRLKDNIWIHVSTAEKIPKYKNMKAFDKNKMRLILVSFNKGETFSWADNKWKQLKDCPGGSEKSFGGLVFYNEKNQKIELHNFSSDSKLCLINEEWKEKEGIGSSILDPYYAIRYDYIKKEENLIAIGNPLNDHNVTDMFIYNGFEWKFLGRLNYDLRQQEVVYDPIREKVVIFIDNSNKSKINEFAIYEIKDNKLSECKQRGEPSLRLFPAWGYDLENKQIIMYGGYKDRFPFSDTLYYETWVIKYNEKESVYIWERIN